MQVVFPTSELCAALSVRDEADYPRQYCSGHATANQLTDNCAGIHTAGRSYDAWQQRLQNLISNAPPIAPATVLAKNPRLISFEAAPAAFPPNESCQMQPPRVITEH
jgi:hypothetical protein